MKIHNVILPSVVAFIAIQPFTSAIAADDEKAPGIYPGIGASFASDNNIYRAETGVVSDSYILVNPGVQYIADIGKHSMDLNYAGSYSYYQSKQDENYLDHAANANFKLDLSPKMDVGLMFGYLGSHEARSTAGTDLVTSPTPNQFTDTNYRADILYGRRTNKAQFGLSYEGVQRKFTNNSQEERDRNIGTTKGTFYYNYSAKTSFLLETAMSDIDYTNPTAPVNLDSTETRVFVGARWDATAKVTGEIKVGSVSKNLTDAGLTDFDGTGYEAIITWKPKSYNALLLTASKSTKESVVASESYYVSDLFDLAYRHAFSEKIELSANITPAVDKYSSGTRTDNLLGMGVGVVYKWNRRLDITGSYISSSRDSNVVGADYKDSIIMLTVSTAAK